MLIINVDYQLFNSLSKPNDKPWLDECKEVGKPVRVLKVVAIFLFYRDYDNFVGLKPVAI